MTKIPLPESAIRLSKEIEIWEIPNFATPSECDNIIEEADKNGYQGSEVDDPGNSFTKSRTSSTAFMNAKNAKVGEIIGNRVRDIVGGEKLEGIQVQRYRNKEKYNPHYDTFDGKDGDEQRNWTAMLYLNTVNDGGGTYFPKIDLRIIPNKGSLILWNNLNGTNCREEKTLHTGEPMGDGEKYIVTYWFRKDGKMETMCPNINGFGTTIKKPKILNVIEKFNNLNSGSKCGWVLGFVFLIIFMFLIIFILIRWFNH